jgi:single-strand DNA-binding protein
MNLNKVFLIGRLTQDIDLRQIASGTSVATINVATNRFYKDKTGGQQKETQFHRVIAWGRLAELSKNYLSKGSLVLIEGRITYRNWLTPTGEKKYTTEIVAENITFGPKGSNSNISESQSDSSTTLEEFEPGSDVFEIPY